MRTTPSTKNVGAWSVHQAGSGYEVGKSAGAAGAKPYTDVQFAVKADRQLAHQPTGKQVGIDVGLKSCSTDSEGETIENPRSLRKAEKHLKRLHRRVSNKPKRSKNRKKAIQR